MSRKNKKPVQEPQAPAPKRTRVEHRGHTAVQGVTNHRIVIGKGGKMVHIVPADRPYTQEELKKAIDDYIVMRQRMG